MPPTASSSPRHLDARVQWVAALFDDAATLEVPSYQRPFCWTELEAGRLLDNLVEAFADGATGDQGDPADYFLGTVLFVAVVGTAVGAAGAAAARGAREIVDGQQRIVTLTILLSVLRDLADSDTVPGTLSLQELIAGAAGPDGRRLALRGADGEFLANFVQAPGACLDMPQDEPATPAQANILAVREHFITELIEREPDWRAAFAAFVLQRCAIVIVTTNRIDSAHQIFTVLNDTGKPLARNDILKAELMGQIAAQARPASLAVWDAAEQRLGAAFETVFSHIRAMHGRSGGQVIEAIRTIVRDSGGAESFIARELAPAAATYGAILERRHAGAAQSEAINTLLGYLGWLPGADWVPSAVLFALGPGRDPARLLAFLTALDRFAYGLRILGHGADKRAARFAAIASAVRHGRDPLAPGGPLAFAREEEKSIGYNLRALHARNPQTCKLLLMRLNDLLVGRVQALALEQVTIEHVLPQKIGPASPWRQLFPDADERERCTTSLGNLVLLGRHDNERARNLDFATKQQIYAAAVRGDANALLDEVAACTTWSPHEVGIREKSRLQQIAALWQFEADKDDPVRDAHGAAGPVASRRSRRATPRG